MSLDVLRTLTTPEKIAEAGERIYDQRWRAELEPQHPGEFVAIDVSSSQAYVGKYPEDALTRAREAAPHALLHLIRIGAPEAFKVGYAARRTSDEWWDRPLRSTP
jgi:hypothetical protein